MTLPRSATALALPFVLTFALAAVLLAQAPQAPHPAASNRYLGNRESIRGGMALYRQQCADCHGLDGTGYRGPDLVAAISGGMVDERLFDTIRKGVPGTEMPAASTIDVADDDILQVIAYLKSIGSVAPPERPAGSVANGERLFTQQCTSCHRVAGRGG